MAKFSPRSCRYGRAGEARPTDMATPFVKTQGVPSAVPALTRRATKRSLPIRMSHGGNRRGGFPSPPVGFPNMRRLINILIDPRWSCADGEVLVALLQVPAGWGSPPYGNSHALHTDSGRATRRSLAHASGYQAKFADSNVARRKP